MDPNRIIISLKQICTAPKQAAIYKEIHPLKNLQWHINQAEFQYIKTNAQGGWKQLVGILTGDISPIHGEMNLLGSEVMHLTRAYRCNLLRENIGFILGDCDLIPYLTILENIYLPIWGISNAINNYRTHIDALLHWHGLEELKDNFPGQIPSLAVTQVCHLRAFIHQPRLVLVIWKENWLLNTLIDLEQLAQATQTSLLVFLPNDTPLANSHPFNHYLDNGVLSPYIGVKEEHDHTG